MHPAVRGLVSILVAAFAGLTLGPLLIPDPTGVASTLASVALTTILALALYRHLRASGTLDAR